MYTVHLDSYISSDEDSFGLCLCVYMDMMMCALVLCVANVLLVLMQYCESI